MNDHERAALRARGEEFVRSFMVTAGGSRDLVEAVRRVLAPDARVRVQSGEVLPRDLSLRQAMATSTVFPDMEVEFEEGLFPDDRVILRVRMTGRSRVGTAFVPAGGHLDAGGAIVARVRPDLLVGELWTFLNPGFPFAFPPRGVQLARPPRDHATEDDARALYLSWVRSAETDEDFVSSIARSLAPDGVVHLGNGDVTGSDGLAELFARITSALHDLTIEIEDVAFDGPHVAALFKMSGVHRGSIGVFPASGRVLPSTGLIVVRAGEGGLAREVWVYLAPAYALMYPPGRR